MGDLDAGHTGRVGRRGRVGAVPVGAVGVAAAPAAGRLAELSAHFACVAAGSQRVQPSGPRLYRSRRK